MILLSIGHHFNSPGALIKNPENGFRFTEFEEATRWVAMISNILGSKSQIVPPGFLRHKAEWINHYARHHKGSHIAAEIHFNAAPNGSAAGCMTLHYPGSEKGIRVAELVQAGMAEIIKPDLGIREGYYRLDPTRGVDYFLRKTVCPSIIVEPQYIYHIDQIKKDRDQVCKNIAEALETADREFNEYGDGRS